MRSFHDQLRSIGALPSSSNLSGVAVAKPSGALGHTPSANRTSGNCGNRPGDPFTDDHVTAGAPSEEDSPRGNFAPPGKLSQLAPLAVISLSTMWLSHQLAQINPVASVVPTLMGLAIRQAPEFQTGGDAHLLHHDSSSEESSRRGGAREDGTEILRRRATFVKAALLYLDHFESSLRQRNFSSAIDWGLKALRVVEKLPEDLREGFEPKISSCRGVFEENYLCTTEGINSEPDLRLVLSQLEKSCLRVNFVGAA